MKTLLRILDILFITALPVGSASTCTKIGSAVSKTSGSIGEGGPGVAGGEMLSMEEVRWPPKGEEQVYHRGDEVGMEARS